MYETAINEKPARIDWLMIPALLGLMVFGVCFIYSATLSSEAGRALSWLDHLFVRQTVWYGLGITAGVMVCLLDYRLIARWSLVIYWGSILLLAAVLIKGIGTMRFGARRWIDLGFFSLQPSEVAKLAFIVMMAQFLSRPQSELRLPGNFAKAIFLTLLPFLLIFKEPDLGSALMFLPVGLAMMFVAGVPLAFLRRLIGCVGLVGALLLIDILFAPPNWQIKLEEYQRQRLLVYFGRDFAGPDATPEQRQVARDLKRQKSYNSEQALISVGSGGFLGKGWRQGTQNALGYLPRAVAHNDFIFSVVAEESGFVGSVVVITLYTVVLLVGLRIASQARDRLGKLLAVGVVTLLFSHVFINIGMNIRIMPVTGVPLPLLSYGGSSVLCSLIAAGLLQNVHLHRKSY
jgi:rod shape determining protein RodA